MQTGDLVAEDDSKAMELFAKVANEYADGNPHGPDAPFVADAFVTLGAYYQSGIPGAVDADPGRARRFFAYAASYFGDADAQYLAGHDVPRTGRAATRTPGRRRAGSSSPRARAMSARRPSSATCSTRASAWTGGRSKG